MPLFRSATPSTPDRRLPRDKLAHFPVLAGEHPTKWEFPEYLRNEKCAWLSALGELYENPICFPASLSPEAGLLLHGLIRNLRPRLIVEIGSFVSVSTHWMAGALVESGVEPTGFGRIHCFDLFGPIRRGAWREAEMTSGVREFVAERLGLAGLSEYVRLHKGDSSSGVRELHGELAAAGGVDLAFIDGDHGVRGACADLAAVEPVLNTGGYVVLHDVFPEQCGGHEGPRHILDNLGRVADGVYEQIELYLGPLNYGLGLLRRVG